MKNIEAGTYYVTVSSIDFTAQRHTITITEEKVSSFKIVLVQGGLMLADVVVTSSPLRSEVNTMR